MTADYSHRKPHTRSPTSRERDNERRRQRRAKEAHDEVRARAFAAGLLTTPPEIPTLADLMRAIP